MRTKLFLSVTVLTVLFTPTIAYAQEISEEITLSTYYPAPYGEYDELRANAMAIGPNYSDPAQHSWGGSGDITGDLVVEGNVGIGTTNPTAKLEVQGGAIKATGGLIIETRNATDPTSPVDGQMWLRTDINP